MIPRDEIENMLVIVSDAIHLAAEGSVDDGYADLLAGLHRAERLRETGEPWVEDLVHHYQFTMRQFAERFHVLTPQ
jgi:hypothetical protein